jgi:hypothetical protein
MWKDAIHEQSTMHSSCRNRHAHHSPNRNSRLLLLADRLLRASISTKALPPTLKHLIKIILSPPDIRRQTGKLPHAIYLLVPMLVGAVGIALIRDGGQRFVGVLLVGDVELVPGDALGGGDHLPLGGTAEVLGFESRVAEDGGGGDHGEEFGGGHGGPGFVQEGGVIYKDGGGDDLGEAVPVLVGG